MVAAPTMRSSVRGARSSIWLSTDTLLVNEKPSPGQPYSSPVDEVLHEDCVLVVPGLVEPEALLG